MFCHLVAIMLLLYVRGDVNNQFELTLGSMLLKFLLREFWFWAYLKILYKTFSSLKISWGLSSLFEYTTNYEQKFFSSWKASMKVFTGCKENIFLEYAWPYQKRKLKKQIERKAFGWKIFFKQK